MNPLFVLMELALQIFASWTLAYHFSLLINLPAKFIILPFLVILGPMMILFRRSWQQRWHHARDEMWFSLGAVVLALTVGIFSLFIANFNPDDYNFFHRALVQLHHLDAPFFLTDTGHNVAGLPPLSLSHVLTSYEPFIAMTAFWIGADPLEIYHNISFFIAGMFLVIVYVLLYRDFGLNQAQALGATCMALWFFLLDLRLSSRSFGNIVLYLWIGKVLLWGILVPMTFLVAYRFLLDPTLKKFSLVAMACICAVGLSGSGIFMIPVLIFAISGAYFLNDRFSLSRLKLAVSLNLASFYCVILALIVATHQPADTSAWSTGEPSIWWQNLGLIIGNVNVLLRDLLILLVLPLTALVKLSARRFLILLSIMLCLTFANLLLGPFWIKTILPATYWRLLFLFPLPWCFGLTIPSFTRPISSKYGGILIKTLAVLVVVATLNAYFVARTALPKIGPSIQFKSPWEYRFPPAELTFARSVSVDLQNKNVLAPESMVVVLALINPTIRFEATRGSLHTFVNARQRDEGLRRLAAQNLVTTCVRSPEAEAALRRSIEQGVNAIIARDCGQKLALTLVEFEPLIVNHWAEVRHNSGYVLFLRRPDQSQPESKD